jgi:tRNA(His) 5'-end guanylyltransferase
MAEDDFGDRMKSYEAVEAKRKLDRNLPIYVRIDGRGFSKFTRDMERPFDARMSGAMIEATRYIVEKSHARIGYTQSDEISLVFLAGENSDILFSGRVQKMTSVLASQTTVAFLNAIRRIPGFEHYADRFPHFDCRVFQLPSTTEAANAFLWRERDAVKNSVSMAARAHFSHSALQNKSGGEMKEMMAGIGVNFDDYPRFFKSGTWVRRVTYERAFTPEELAGIRVEFRPPEGQLVQRSEVREIDIPDFGKVANREDVIFNGADPILKDSSVKQ